MKRNLMSELQQRSRSTFLKCRAPCATARSPVANGQSPRLDPPTAASPALWGAATPPSARAQPHVVPPNDATLNRAAELCGHRPDRATARSYKIDRLPLIVVRKRSSLTSFHTTPPGSSSLLQVSINSEEVHYHTIRAMLPASFPDKDDVVSAIFEDMLTGTLRREDVRGRVQTYIAAHNRMYPTKYAKFGDSPLVSLDEVLFDDGATTRGDTVSRGLWE